MINGSGERRHSSADDKVRFLEETLAPGAVVSEVVRLHGLRPHQVFKSRREARMIQRTNRSASCRWWLSGTAGSSDFADKAGAPTANGTEAEQRDRPGDRRSRGAGGSGTSAIAAVIQEL
jgi:transposase-like protein